jgi:putative colanic acid biosynthesis acetyltransferase WcaF
MLQNNNEADGGVDIVSNRRMRKWTRFEILGRVIWEYLGAPMFALIPRPLWSVRRALLRVFGARIGSDVHIYPSVRIAIPWNLEVAERAAVGDRAIIYNLGMITIASAATISQGAHLCGGTHDYRRADFALVKAPISVGSGAWICADAFVGPGVTIGARAIIGARSVVTKDVADNAIVAGNPAREIGKRPR